MRRHKTPLRASSQRPEILRGLYYECLLTRPELKEMSTNFSSYKSIYGMLSRFHQLTRLLRFAAQRPGVAPQSLNGPSPSAWGRPHRPPSNRISCRAPHGDPLATRNGGGVQLQQQRRRQPRRMLRCTAEARQWVAFQECLWRDT